MDAEPTDRRIKPARKGFIFRWPIVAILGVSLLGMALVLAAIAGLFALIRQNSELYILFSVLCLLGASYVWGYVLSNVGDNGSETRTFPFNFVIWLFHPPARGEVAAVDNVEPHDFRRSPYYLVAIGFIALVRLVGHLFERAPQVDDLVSLKDPVDERAFLLAEVRSQTLTEIVLGPLQRSARRPRTVRLDDDAPAAEPLSMDPVQYRQLKPKLIWRGERAFWSRDPSRGRRGRRPRYRSIEIAGLNIDELEYEKARAVSGPTVSSSHQAPSVYSQTEPRSGPRS